MWTRVRNGLILAASIGLLLFGMGFAVTTPAQMPDYALVYLDEANQAYLAPQCVHAWARRASETPGRLRRSNAGEARMRGYSADETCARTGAFAPPGPSISRHALERAGLVAPQKEWWDAPYRTEDGMIYPPNTHV